MGPPSAVPSTFSAGDVAGGVALNVLGTALGGPIVGLASSIDQLRTLLGSPLTATVSAPDAVHAQTVASTAPRP